MQSFLQALYFPAWYFVLYSFLGWCLEVCFCTVVTGKWVNRGFLNGPVCPIYGFGMLVITAVLGPLQQNLLLLFVGGMVLTSTLELITGFVLKQLFHTRWWDYSDQKFQLGGYICLKFSLAWGLGGTLAVRLLHPAVRRLVEALPRQAGIPLLVIILLVFVADTIVTVNTIARLNRDLGEMARIMAKLHTASDRIAENLGENALSAQEKLNEGRAALAERREELSDTAMASRAELNARLDLLRADWKDHARFGKARLLRAFPRMRSDRYAATLEEVRSWLRENLQSDPAEK